MNVAIIIPTYNAGSGFGQLLEQINVQTIDFVQKLVIDSSSTDSSVEIAQQYGFEVITIDNADFDHGGTRNLGLNAATADVVVYLTQDILIEQTNAIELLVASFNHPHVAVAYGRQLPHANATFFAQQLRYNNFKPESAIVSLGDKATLGFKTFFCSNSFAAYRVSALKEIGGFRDHLLFGEDACATAELLTKGYEKVYCSDSTIYHSHNYTIQNEFCRYFDIGVFHATESWLISTFGTALGEGLSYVKQELQTLWNERKYGLILQSLLRNGAKFIGYRMGKNYKYLPLGLIKKCTMNPKWWVKQK